jgi:hypothetical protein
MVVWLHPASTRLATSARYPRHVSRLGDRVLVEEVHIEVEAVLGSG